MLTSSALRPARAFVIGLQPALVAPCSATTACFAAPARPCNTKNTSRPFFASSSKSGARIAVRFNSTASTPQPQQTQLSWNDFLALRKTRRRINVFASGVAVIGTTWGGLTAFFSQGYDATLAATTGLDPIVVAGLSTLSLMAAGWLIGPFFGNALFNMRYSAIRGDIQRKEREFFNRIKTRRVDPSSSSIANPVPDYYGEKIGSVAGYRRWLKDQRAFNLKRGESKTGL